MNRAHTIYYATLIWIILNGSESLGQIPVKEFVENDLDIDQFKNYTSNKQIPKQIQLPALIALSYFPELSDIKIKFRFKKRITPLSIRPTIVSLFKSKGKRGYVLTISRSSRKVLNPIIFSNLPFNAQIGVFGHELSHAADFNQKNTKQFIGIMINMLSRKKVDCLEFNTDLICIQHGLGHQLYEWSRYVRVSLKINEWKGASQFSEINNPAACNQRYMNPETIKKFINNFPLYLHAK